MEDSLLTMLPETYEGIDVLGVHSAAACTHGIGNSEACHTGQNFGSCSTGGCFRG